ncbi:MAG: FAD-binding protein, partial [Thermoguttaceae bacterium]|nr:FAD-binding protein [Thermoguttaceae bacterium]
METVRVHTLIIGSGAAGLSAAIHLHRFGITDLLIATESLHGGTSINTGSDKQTYYKLSLCGADADSVRDMAETYFAGGSMHGDLALAEAANSVRAFMNLTELGLPFPADDYGQFVGYKTDHDPRQRATSIGPYTSREMCRAMIREVQKLGIPVRENVFVRELLVQQDPDPAASETAPHPVTGEVYGAEFYVMENGTETGILRVLAENVVFAVGGPGGLYRTSVY